MGNIQSRLKEIRKIYGLNQAEFAKRIEITQGTYSGIEIGREALTERNRKLICLEFGINEEWLLTGAGEMVKSGEISHEGKQLLKIFDKLEPEGQKEVQKYTEERLKLQEYGAIEDRAINAGFKGKTLKIIEVNEDEEKGENNE